MSQEPEPIQVPRDARCEAWPLGPRVRIDVHPGQARDVAIERDVEVAWAGLKAANPRLYDGPILSVTGIDIANHRITAEVRSYKWLAVQDVAIHGSAIGIGTEQFSVTGVLTKSGPDGREHLLLGRRATTTRIYGGMWELAPSGGVDLPPQQASRPAGSPTTLDEHDLIHQLRIEAQEELGPRLSLSNPRVVALCRDPFAHSLDVVIRAEASIDEGLAALDAQDHPWEYDAARWVPLDALHGWDHAQDPMIPPTRALLRHFGWL